MNSNPEDLSLNVSSKLSIKDKNTGEGRDKEADINSNSSDMEVKEDHQMRNSSPTVSNYLPWNDYFMSLCFLTAARSKDPNTKVGACIIDSENRIISLGYNGMPRGIRDSDLPWGKVAAHVYDTKYPYVCHAEMNAIMNGNRTTYEDCCLYVTKFPCCECAKLIIQSGIKKVTFAEVKKDPWEEQIPSSKMFSLAGVTCRKFAPSIQRLSMEIIDGIGSVSITN